MASCGKSGEDLELVSVQVVNYFGGYVEVVLAPPTAINIVGRFDLFASSALKKAWNVVPAPGGVIVDVSQTTEMDEPGRDALLALLASSGDRWETAISTEGAPEQVRALLPCAGRVYSSKATALDALGGSLTVAPILVKLWNPRRA